MLGTCRLSELPQGAEAVVTGICKKSGMHARLRELGIVEGTVIKCVKVSPLGDPSAFLIRGAVIALRREDSIHVTIFRGCRR